MLPHVAARKFLSSFIFFFGLVYDGVRICMSCPHLPLVQKTNIGPITADTHEPTATAHIRNMMSVDVPGECYALHELP